MSNVLDGQHRWSGHAPCNKSLRPSLVNQGEHLRRHREPHTLGRPRLEQPEPREVEELLVRVPRRPCRVRVAEEACARTLTTTTTIAISLLFCTRSVRAVWLACSWLCLSHGQIQT